jgi:hypothetical protein
MVHLWLSYICSVYIESPYMVSVIVFLFDHLVLLRRGAEVHVFDNSSTSNEMNTAL